jgi:hypothetical protein
VQQDARGARCRIRCVRAGLGGFHSSNVKPVDAAGGRMPERRNQRNTSQPRMFQGALIGADRRMNERGFPPIAQHINRVYLLVEQPAIKNRLSGPERIPGDGNVARKVRCAGIWAASRNQS